MHRQFQVTHFGGFDWLNILVLGPVRLEAGLSEFVVLAQHRDSRVRNIVKPRNCVFADLTAYLPSWSL